MSLQLLPAGTGTGAVPATGYGAVQYGAVAPAARGRTLLAGAGPHTPGQQERGGVVRRRQLLQSAQGTRHGDQVPTQSRSGLSLLANFRRKVELLR